MAGGRPNRKTDSNEQRASQQTAAEPGGNT